MYGAVVAIVQITVVLLTVCERLSHETIKVFVGVNIDKLIVFCLTAKGNAVNHTIVCSYDSIIRNGRFANNELSRMAAVEPDFTVKYVCGVPSGAHIYSSVLENR